MSNKSQTIFAVCFGLFLAVVVTVSLLFADKLPHATQPEGIAGGYLNANPVSEYNPGSDTEAENNE